MSKLPLDKLPEWTQKAAKKNAIVPFYFEVSPVQVFITCGNCQETFVRNLIPNINEPTFVCPNENCKQRNWVPVHFKLK